MILVNDRGEVTESTIANLAVRIDGAWCTPPLDSGLLGGTYRAVLVGDRTLVERPITVAKLRVRRRDRPRELRPRVAPGRAGPVTDQVRTVYLGQYTHGHAETMAAAFEEAGIEWWYKAPGFLSQVWEHGVRLFVDRERLDEAKAIAERVLAGHSEGEGSSSGQT